MNIIILGGGAAGFFAALAAKAADPKAHVHIIEKNAALLAKVRVSGGGRCNVTHACFDSRALMQNYPRGGKELLGPFSRFQPRDTIAWFEARGVPLKVEADGRMFPRSDDSNSIIDCLMREASRLGVVITTKQKVRQIFKTETGFGLMFEGGEQMVCDKLLLATGSSEQGHRFAKELGHTIQEPVPSLFTFNVPSFPLMDLAGIAVEKAVISIKNFRLQQQGPLLITHWGFSGPAALKLSAWGARLLHKEKYQVPLTIDWLPDFSHEEVKAALLAARKEHPKQMLSNCHLFHLPKNLWKRLVERSGIGDDIRLSAIGNAPILSLIKTLKDDPYQVSGKTTHKEEFVTCGGVTLSEIDFKTMESRICPGLYFAGEVLDIDAVTGGFNFQNAWTTGWLAGLAMAF